MKQSLYRIYRVFGFSERSNDYVWIVDEKFGEYLHINDLTFQLNSMEEPEWQDRFKSTNGYFNLFWTEHIFLDHIRNIVFIQFYNTNDAMIFKLSR